MIIKCGIALGALLFPVFLIAQSVSLDSLLKANSYPLYEKQGHFSGEGAEILSQVVEENSIVGIAENHNTREIPLFTQWVYHLQQSHHPKTYLVLEQDAVMMKMAGERKAPVFDLARKYLHGFTFISDQELTLIQDVIDSDTSLINPVWGCDQVFGATHVLEMLKRDLGNTGASVWLNEALSRVASKERSRDLEKYHFLSDTSWPQNYFEKGFATMGKLNEHQWFYCDALIQSQQMYRNIQLRNYYQGRSQREAYMQRRFSEEYRHVTKEEGSIGLVLKMGHYHLMYGGNTGSKTSNVGTLAKEMAQFNREQMALINMQVYRTDGSDWDYFEGLYPMIARHSSTDRWTLFDLKAIRPYLYNGVISSQLSEDELKRWNKVLYQYDYLITIGNGGDATWSRTGVEY